MVYYNFASVPGLSVGYNGAITYDSNAASDDAWTVPLGAVVGRTFALGDAYAIDLSIGPYFNVVRPDGAGEWLLKVGVILVFP